MFCAPLQLLLVLFPCLLLVWGCRGKARRNTHHEQHAFTCCQIFATDCNSTAIHIHRRKLHAVIRFPSIITRKYHLPSVIKLQLSFTFLKADFRFPLSTGTPQCNGHCFLCYFLGPRHLASRSLLLWKSGCVGLAPTHPQISGWQT